MRDQGKQTIRMVTTVVVAAALLAGCGVVDSIDRAATSTTTPATAPTPPEGVQARLGACIDAAHLSEPSRDHVTKAIADAITNLGAIPAPELDGRRPSRQEVVVAVRPIISNSVSTEVAPIASGTIPALAGLATPKPSAETFDGENELQAWRVDDSEAAGLAEARRAVAAGISRDVLGWKPAPAVNADIGGCLTAIARDLADSASKRVLVLATDINPDGEQQATKDFERAVVLLKDVDVLVIQSCATTDSCEAAGTGIGWWFVAHGVKRVDLQPANTSVADLTDAILRRAR